MPVKQLYQIGENLKVKLNNISFGQKTKILINPLIKIDGV